MFINKKSSSLKGRALIHPRCHPFWLGPFWPCPLAGPFSEATRAPTWLNLSSELAQGLSSVRLHSRNALSYRIPSLSTSTDLLSPSSPLYGTNEWNQVLYVHMRQTSGIRSYTSSSSYSKRCKGHLTYTPL